MRAKFLNKQARLEKQLQDAVERYDREEEAFDVADVWDQINRHQEQWMFGNTASQAEIGLMLEKCKAIWAAFPKKTPAGGASSPWVELYGFPAEWPAQLHSTSWWTYSTGRVAVQDEEELQSTCYASIALTAMLLIKHGPVHLSYPMRRDLAESLAHACRSGRLFMKVYYDQIHMSDPGMYNWTPRMRQ